MACDRPAAFIGADLAGGLIMAEASEWVIVDPDSNTVLNIVMAYNRTDAMIGVDLKTYPHALAFTYAEYLALDPMPTW